MSFDIGPSIPFGPSFRFEKKDSSMSDDQKEIQIKKESQVGFVNVEDIELNQTWFPLHITSVGSVLGVVLVVFTLIFLWHNCRKKTMLKLIDCCHDCRKRRSEREQDRALELLEREIAAQSHEATTSHQGRHHRGHKGHRHANRGGHHNGLARGHGMAIESPRHSGMEWTQAEEQQMTRAIKNNLETMARMALPEVHMRPLGARPKDDVNGEDDDIDVSK